MSFTETSRKENHIRIESNYGVAVVRFDKNTDTFILIKNLKSVGNFMASDRKLFRQYENQETEMIANFEIGLELARQWLTNLESEVAGKLSNTVQKLTEQATAKGYKPGKIFYQMKDYYGYEIANEFCNAP